MDLHYITATGAMRKFETGDLSPVDLLEASIERTARPLEGVPLIIKEEHPNAGMLAEDGSLLGKGNVAEITHPIVERVFNSGAVVHGRTTTPEFCCAPVTHTKLCGVTRNPHNPEMTCGGSSGGSGAALAAGSTVLATGSDVGGSIRIPASFCGVVGFKPRYLVREPGLPPFNSDTYCADGPMGRSVADVAALQNVIVGPWAGDPATLRPALMVPGEAGSLAGLKIALSYTLGAYTPDPAVIANTHSFADALRAAGATVDEVDLPWTQTQLNDTAWAHFGQIMGSFIEGIGEGDPALFEQLMPYARAFVEAAGKGGDFVEGLEAESAFYHPLGDIHEKNDALICPTIANTGLAADYPGTNTIEAFSDLMTLPFNVIGRVPVLAVPSGRAPNGVPTGVQIVGRTYDDATVFRIGAAVERELALWTAKEWWPAL